MGKAIRYPIVGIIIGIFLIGMVELLTLRISSTLGIICRYVGSLLVFFILLKSNYHSFRKASLVYKLFVYWSVLIILRGSLIGNYRPGMDPTLFNIINSLMGGESAAAYLLPLIVIMKVDLRALSYLKRLSIAFCIISFFLLFVMRGYLLSAEFLLGVSGFDDTEGGTMATRTFVTLLFPGLGLTILMALSYNYLSGKLKILIPISLVLFFFGMVAAGGRAQTVLSFGYIASMLFLIYKYSFVVNQKRKKIISRNLKRGLILFFVLFFIVSIIYLYNSTDYFDYIMLRAFGGKDSGGSLAESGREALTEAMIKDFNNHPFDWIIGRGVNGAYIITDLFGGGQIGNKRMYMEWGFLFLILKGGIIYLVLNTLVLMHAVYVGFKKSNNVLCKAMAFFCFWQIVGLSCGICEPYMTDRFAISWFCVGCLENKDIRNLDNLTISSYFNYTRRRNGNRKRLLSECS